MSELLVEPLDAVAHDPDRVATVRRDTWNEHWLRRRGRDPHRKADSFRYKSTLDVWPDGVRTVLDAAGGDGTFAFLARERYPQADITVLDQCGAAAETARQQRSGCHCSTSRP